MMLPEAKLYVDGALRRAAGDKTYDDIGPWTGDVVGKAADASREDVEEAIAAARRESPAVSAPARSVSTAAPVYRATCPSVATK